MRVSFFDAGSYVSLPVACILHRDESDPADGCIMSQFATARRHTYIDKAPAATLRYYVGKATGILSLKESIKDLSLEENEFELVMSSQSTWTLRCDTFPERADDLYAPGTRFNYQLPT